MKKRILASLLCICMLVGLLPVTALAAEPPTTSWADNAAAGFAGGNGTAANPYQIATAGQLAYWAKTSNSYTDWTTDTQFYKLTGPIDLSAHLWVPIGQYGAGNSNNYSFSGTLDGNGQTITGLTMTSTGTGAVGTSRVGLFAYLQNDAVVKNLTLQSVNIEMNDNLNQYTGAVAGYANSASLQSGSVIGGRYVGGLLGYAGGTLRDCKNYAAISCGGTAAGDNPVCAGGLAGTGGSMINCLNEGTVTVNFKKGYVGGLTGSGTSEVISNSVNKGAVTVTMQSGSEMKLGGIAGDSGITFNCVNTARVTLNMPNATSINTNNTGIGGITGYTSSSFPVENCYNSGEVKVIGKSGALLSFPDKAYISSSTYNDKVFNCYWSSALGTDSTAQTRGTGYYDASTGALTAKTGGTLPYEGNLLEALNLYAATRDGNDYAAFARWEGNANAPTHKGAANVSGVITDSSGALTGATVQAIAAAGGVVSATTAAGGAYTLANLTPGIYTIKASTPNHMEAGFALHVVGENAVGKDIKLLKPTAFANNTIQTADQLAYVAQQVNSGTNSYEGVTLKLGADINLAGYYWTPIGSNTDNRPFKGSLNGQNYTISNLTIQQSGDYAGLFAYAGVGGRYNETAITQSFENLKLTNVNIRGGDKTGALIGNAFGTPRLENIEMAGTVRGMDNTGGLVGQMGGGACVGLKNTGGTVTGTGQVGGILGDYGGDMTYLARCQNAAEITVTKSGQAGGIAGRIDAYKTAADKGSDPYPSIVEDCANTGAVTSTDYGSVGGIAGSAAIDLLRCENSGTIQGGPDYNSGAGGVVGSLNGNKYTMDRCVNTGAVTAEGAVGGLAASSDIIIINSANHGTLVNTKAAYSGSHIYIGGLVGHMSAGGIYNSYNTGSATTPGGAYLAGGLIGYGGQASNMVQNCYTTGTVTGSTAQNCSFGALVGELKGYSLDNSYYLTGAAGEQGAVGVLGTDYYTPKSYTGCASFTAGGELTAEAGHTVIGGETELLAALNAFVDAKSGTIPGIINWVADSDSTNSGYPVFAPSGELTGTLTGSDNAAVANATVKLLDRTGKEQGSGASTAAGAYSFADVPAGEYTLHVEKGGYQTVRTLVTMVGDTTANLKVIKLEPIRVDRDMTITSIGQLAWVAQQVNSGANGFSGYTFTLANDLALTGYQWTPIGTPEKPFKGTLNGGDKTISGLTITTIGNEQGLFGVTEDGAIQALNLTGANVRGGLRVGILAGETKSTALSDISVTGKVFGRDLTGGMVGVGKTAYDKAKITQNLRFDGAVSGLGKVGGMFATLNIYGDNSVLENLTVSGTVENNSTDYSAYMGGIAAELDGGTGTLRNVVNKAAITSRSGGHIAGLFANVGGQALLFEGCRNEGAVTSYSGYDVYGLTGGASNSTFRNCANTGNITGLARQNSVSGLSRFAILMENCYNTGKLETKTGSITILAYLKEDGNIKNCYNAGQTAITDEPNSSSRYLYSTANYEKATISNVYWLTGTVYENDSQNYPYFPGTTSGIARFDAAGALTAYTGHTIIDNQTTLLGALNKWVTDNKAATPDLVSWSADSGSINSGYPIFALPATLTFSGNGNTEGTAPAAVKDYLGGTVTLPGGGTLAKTGGVFAGWNTKADGTGDVYEAETEYVIASVTDILYAYWLKGLDSVDIAAAEATYTGGAVTPVLTLTDGGVSLVLDTDYTVEKITAKNGSDTVTPINAGTYTVHLAGKGRYTGVATVDFTIKPKTVTIVDADYVVTKEYDRTNNAPGAPYANIKTNVDGITAKVTGITSYSTWSLGTSYSVTLTLGTLEGADAANYTLGTATTHQFSRAAITQRVVATVEIGTIAVSKPWDNTVSSAAATKSGKAVFKDSEGNAINYYEGELNIGLTYGDYDSATVGDDKQITIALGELTSANYKKAEGFPTTLTLTNAVITPADYVVAVTTPQQLKVGSGLGGLTTPATGTGVEGAEVTGTFELFSDSGRTTEATDADVNTLEVGASKTLYWRFTPASTEEAYGTTPKTGTLVVEIVDGDPQTLEWSDGVGGKMVTYGDGTVAGKTANLTTGGGDITYSSSNPDVAEVDADTGELTIKAASTEAVTITATAAAVPGTWAQASITYPLTVSKKPVTVTVSGQTKVYGTANPALTLDDVSSVLADGDSETDLGVTLSCAAAENAPVVDDGYPITGTSTSANYNVTVTPGTLTVTKASAPTVADVAKTLLYSVAHTDVAVSITGLPADCGNITFTAGTPTDEDSILGAVSNTATGIKFSTNVGSENDTATIPITVSMQNYEDVIVDVVVTLVNKTEVTITGITATGKTYDGAALAYTGAPANAQGYTGTYEIAWSTADGSAPKDAGTYELTIKIPDADPDFMGELVIDNLVIAPKAITAKPKSLSIYNGDELPTAFALEYATLVNGDTITVTGAPAFELQKEDGTTLADSKTNGSYVIKWTNADDVTLTNANYAITKGDGTLTISTYSGGGGGGAVTPPPAAPDVVTGGGSSTATIETKPTTSGDKTTASITGDSVKNAIKAAEEAAAKAGTKPALEIKVETPKNAKELEVTLPKSSVADAANSKAESLSISSGVGEITISAETLDSIAKQATGSDVKISVGAVDTQKSLNEKQRAAVGDAPVYDISITSGNKQITGFDGGLMTISLPYTLKPGENPAGIVVWYVNEQGNIEKVTTMYDVKTKTVIFTTNHLSLYAIGYDETLVPVNPFTDIAEGTYYYDAVLWAVSKNVTNGTSATTFSPDVSCTRAQVVTLLWNAMGKPVPSSASNPFTDVEQGSYYYDAVLWAAEKGITGGTSATTFSPDMVVTRSQFVTFLHRAAGKPAAAAENPFTDVTDTTAYYYDAVLWAYGEEVTRGTSGTTFSPDATCTRAQVVTFLYNYFGN